MQFQIGDPVAAEDAHLTASEREEYDRLKAAIEAIPALSFTEDAGLWPRRDLVMHRSMWLLVISFALLLVSGGLALLSQLPQYETRSGEFLGLSALFAVGWIALLRHYPRVMKKLESDRVAALTEARKTMKDFLYDTEFQRQRRADADRFYENSRERHVRKARDWYPYA